MTHWKIANPLKVACIGAGLQGMGHVQSYLALPTAELVAIADVREDHVRKVAAERGIPHAYTDFHQMLREHPEIQAVSVVTPDHLHLEPTLAALEAGKHVLLEKPMAQTVADAQLMADKAAEKGLQIMVNYSHRCQAPTLSVVERAARGDFGTPRYAHARLNNTLYVPMKMLSWSSHTELPHWLFSHEVDRVRWIMGSEATRVYAVSNAGVLQEKGINVQDLYHATVEFANGAIATFVALWFLPETMPSVAQCYTHFAFSKAWVVLDHTVPLVQVATPGGYSTPGFLAGSQRGKPWGTIHDAVSQFVEDILAGRPTVVTAQDAVAVTRIVCAIAESARERQPVELD
ncbi:MAG: Gfo/Idh/MocA family oxidoreductase [Chloroflexi bacterium]|nr:Gfo/Idh/MocA family oxidoreductase [Chloroflexota bacterium]